MYKFKNFKRGNKVIIFILFVASHLKCFLMLTKE